MSTDTVCLIVWLAIMAAIGWLASPCGESVVSRHQEKRTHEAWLARRAAERTREQATDE